ncbi:CUZD1 [Branchiostoma lanceolatum]|uniref:CUZD1 protein n=1 Tax=Branchiostoma lanceolatum TaxID=7740 RepID=A0A8J9ZBX5_BRALA|nr:CUZD1 [Branchiostoma lanceolatum]
MIMKSPLNACGTTSYETPDYIIYDNVVTDESLARAGEIIRDCGFEMRIQCQIPRRLQVSGDFDPIQVPEMYAAVGTGDINVIMHFCTDSVCSNFKPYPVTYRVCEQVYVEVQLLSSDPDLSILVLTGEATPSMSRTGSPLYDIINQGPSSSPRTTPRSTCTPTFSSASLPLSATAALKVVPLPVGGAATSQRRQA